MFVNATGPLINSATVSANEDDPDGSSNTAESETSVELPELILVNNAIQLTGIKTSYDQDDNRALAGVFTLTATWVNIAEAGLFDMHAEIVILTNGNVVLNADDGSGVVGSIVTVSGDALGADEVGRWFVSNRAVNVVERDGSRDRSWRPGVGNRERPSRIGRVIRQEYGCQVNRVRIFGDLDHIVARLRRSTRPTAR